MKKTFWNDFFINFIVFFIYYIIISFLCKQYLPPTYYENGQPKYITILIICGSSSLLSWLTTNFIKF
jgi:hypothetical protein